MVAVLVALALDALDLFDALEAAPPFEKTLTE